MLHVTHAAREALHEMILDSAPDLRGRPGLGFRVVTCRQPSGEDSVGLALDEARPGDRVVYHERRAVLLMDESVYAALEGVTLDFVETIQGRQLTVD